MLLPGLKISADAVYQFFFIELQEIITEIALCDCDVVPVSISQHVNPYSAEFLKIY